MRAFQISWGNKTEYSINNVGITAYLQRKFKITLHILLLDELKI